MRPNRFTVDQIIKIIAETDLPGSSVLSVSSIMAPKTGQRYNLNVA